MGSTERLRIALALLLATALSPCVARGQDAQAPSADAPPAEVAVDQASEPEAPPSAEEIEAHRLVDQGDALYDAGNFSGAIAEFERAYELLAGRPNRYVLLYNVGLAYERLFRYDRALAYYHRYLEESGADADGRAEVEGTIRTLENLLGTVRVVVNVPQASVLIDDQEVGTAPGELRVPGGRHVIEVRASDHLPARREFQVVSRGSIDVELALDPLPEPTRGISPAWMATSGAVAAVGLVLGVVFGGVALGDNMAADARAGTPDAFLTTAGTLREISDYSLACDLAFAGAALFGTTAIVLAFLTDFGTTSESAPAPVAFRVSPRDGALQLVW